MRKIHLDSLKIGLPGISPAAGTFLAEAAAYSLHVQGHRSGIILEVEGDFNDQFIIEWTDKIDNQVLNTWKDHNEAVEYAATAIAILLLLKFTNFVIAERSFQHGIGDYILTTKEQNAYIGNEKQISGFLEVSGIWQESKGNTLNIRLRKKKEKFKKRFGKSAFIIIAEFSLPKAKMIQL